MRELIDRHLQAHFRGKATWRVVAKDLRRRHSAPGLPKSRSRSAWRYCLRASSVSRHDAPDLARLTVSGAPRYIGEWLKTEARYLAS